MYSCRYCSLELLTSKQLGLHIGRCKENPEYEKIQFNRYKRISDSYSLRNPKVNLTLKCTQCSKEFIKELRKSQISKLSAKVFCSVFCSRCHSSQATKKLRILTLRATLKNKGCNPDKFCSTCGSRIPTQSLKKYCSKKCKCEGLIKAGVHIRAAETFKKRYRESILSGTRINLGGFRSHGNDRYKHGTYQNYYFQSSWEFYWIVYSLDHGIKFERNTRGFPYTFQGQETKFYPDFILENGEYVEIKGWMNKREEAKQECFPKELSLTYVTNVDQEKRYVEEVRGFEFIEKFLGVRKQSKVKNSVHYKPTEEHKRKISETLRNRKLRVLP